MSIDVMITNMRGPVDQFNPMPVTVIGGNAGGGGGGGGSSTFTANSSFTGTNTAGNGVGTVTNATQDYTAVAANASRKFMSITNTGSSSITVNPSGSAYQGAALVGIPVPAGDTYEWSGVSLPSGALHVASAAPGNTYFVLEG